MKSMFETERLVLREPKLEDLDDWCSVSDESRADVETFLLRSIREFEQFGFSMGTLVSKDSGEFVGRAGIYHWFAPDVNQDLEIGCYISSRQRNKGYGTELTRAMFDWGFTHLGVDRLTGLSDISLSNSHTVLERSGMRRVEQLNLNGDDVILFEITRKSWERRRLAGKASGERAYV